MPFYKDQLRFVICVECKFYMPIAGCTSQLAPYTDWVIGYRDPRVLNREGTCPYFEEIKK